jgi:hypothetical protein
MSISGEQAGVQRLPRRVHKHYAAVRLYLDDAEEILELLKQHCDRVAIEAEGYSLPSLDHLPELARDKIRTLGLTGWKGTAYLTVMLGPRVAYAVLSGDTDMALKGVFTQIDAILTKRAPLLQFFASLRTFLGVQALYIVIACSLSLPSFVQVLHRFSTGKAPAFDFSGFGLSDLLSFTNLLEVANFAYGVWFVILLLSNRSVVFLQPWRERTSFWDRNKEQIVVGIIVGVIVAVIASASGYFLGSQH